MLQINGQTASNNLDIGFFRRPLFVEAVQSGPYSCLALVVHPPITDYSNGENLP